MNESTHTQKHMPPAVRDQIDAVLNATTGGKPPPWMQMKASSAREAGIPVADDVPDDQLVRIEPARTKETIMIAHFPFFGGPLNGQSIALPCPDRHPPANYHYFHRESNQRATYKRCTTALLGGTVTCYMTTEASEIIGAWHQFAKL